MPCQMKNPANYDLGDLEGHINGMYDHFASKYGFENPPTMVFDSDPSNQSKVLGKTAYYDPQSLEIHIFVDGRHPKDVLRSIAHELIHHVQNLEGRLDVGGYNGPGYYLENDELKQVEHEAMLEGNATMREYEDTVKYTETKNMSLKEWKNNELNQLLMKKFGILKEEKDVKMVPKSEVPEDAEVVVDDGPGDLVGIKKEGLDEDHCMGKRDEEAEEAQLDEYSYEQEMADRENYKGPRGEPTPPPMPKELSPAEERAAAQKKKGQRTMDKASVPRQFRENKAQELKESLKRIATAKKVFLNNKRIK